MFPPTGKDAPRPCAAAGQALHALRPGDAHGKTFQGAGFLEEASGRMSEDVGTSGVPVRMTSMPEVGLGGRTQGGVRGV
ncbi:hypothetical protein D7X30_35505 [Corallococcus sp. AB011P]|nr:hypothetical protein D7X30_35505 [Corallococcus sp. AB011P]RKH81890.1 hypothetical protein D7Y21_29515 [Corallococcus sp. AB045]